MPDKLVCPFRPAEQPAWNRRGHGRFIDWLVRGLQYVGGKLTHEGADLGIAVGTILRAGARGTVVDRQDGYGGGWGNHVVIDYPALGVQVRYAHLSEHRLNIGDRVELGTVIGLSGGAVGHPGSGSSQGPHLHIEVRRGFVRGGARGTPLDPLEWLIADTGEPLPLPPLAELPPPTTAEIPPSVPTVKEIIDMRHIFTLPGTGQLRVRGDGQVVGVLSDVGRAGLFAIGECAKLDNGDEWVDVTDQFTADQLKAELKSPVVEL